MGEGTLTQVTHPKSDPFDPLTDDPVTHRLLWRDALGLQLWSNLPPRVLDRLPYRVLLEYKCS